MLTIAQNYYIINGYKDKNIEIDYDVINEE